MERLGGWLHPRTAASLAELVRIMNCYYSNLIEGHHIKPRDIERALADDLEKDQVRRNFQIEARAHVSVQQTIDRLYTAGNMPEPASTEFLCRLHRKFYCDAPEAMLWVDNGGHGFRMESGAFRSLPEHNVSVGRHLPPSSDRVAEFMRYFEQRYRLANMGKGERIIAMAASHHLLAYIHPFPDGNGRVSRLMSHAMGLADWLPALAQQDFGRYRADSLAAWKVGRIIKTKWIMPIRRDKATWTAEEIYPKRH